MDDLVVHVTGRGNILRYQVNHLLENEAIALDFGEYASYFSGDIKIMIGQNTYTIPPAEGLVYLSSVSWPSKSPNGGDIYDFSMDIPLSTNMENSDRDISLYFRYLGNTPFITLKQKPTTVISLNTDSVTLASDGTESSVQLSTVGAWTVE